MRYNRNIKRTNSGEDIALENELLTSGVPETRVKEIFKNRIDNEELENIVEETRENEDTRLGVITPDVRRLIEEVKTPNNFVDPLYSQLMKGMISVKIIFIQVYFSLLNSTI